MLHRPEVTGSKIGTSAVDPVLSIRQTAEVLNLSERSLWRLISAGKIRTLRLSARKRGVLASEIARVQSEAAA
jgi:predicted DNA-binding transcriptional regulator AlpA